MAGSGDHCVRRPDARCEVAAHGFETGVVPTRHDQLRERRVCELVEGQVGLVERSTATEHGDELESSCEEVRRELRWIAPHGHEELDDPVGVSQVAVPQPANVRDERAPRRVVGSERRRRRFEDGQRQGGFGPARRRDHGGQAAVGVADEVDAVRHQLAEIVRVDQEVLAIGRWAAPAATSVGNDQPEAVVGERSLLGPLVCAVGERAVDEHDGRAVTPDLDVQVGGRLGQRMARFDGGGHVRVLSLVPVEERSDVVVAMNESTTATKASGWLRCGTWPAPAKVCRSAW